MVYLFLNSISTGEVIIILVFILMFFGSKGVPGIARSLGKGLRQLRDATDDIKRDIRHSVEDIEKDVKRNMDGVNITKDITETQAAIQKNIDDIVKRPTRFVKDNIQEFKDNVEQSAAKEKNVAADAVKEEKVPVSSKEKAPVNSKKKAPNIKTDKTDKE
jgi:sec-independent protein translocase protein TatA